MGRVRSEVGRETGDPRSWGTMIEGEEVGRNGKRENGQPWFAVTHDRGQRGRM